MTITIRYRECYGPEQPACRAGGRGDTTGGRPPPPKEEQRDRRNRERRGGAAVAPGIGNKRQTTQPAARPQERAGGGREGYKDGHWAYSHTELNIRSKRRIEALNRRYPGKLELACAPKGATPI